jgi:hypothetical protein
VIVWSLVVWRGCAALVAIAVRVPAVQDRVMRAAIGRMVAAQPSELFERDALRVLACGTASPLPHPTRAKPCVAVFAAGRFWVVDTGPGSWNGWRCTPGAFRRGYAHHLPLDHIGDLGEFDLTPGWSATSLR